MIVHVCLLQYDPQATGVIDYQALMQQLLHSDYYALYLGSVDNTQNTLDATATFSMITNLKSQFAAQSRKLQQVRFCPWAVQLRIACWQSWSMLPYAQMPALLLKTPEREVDICSIELRAVPCDLNC